MKKITLKVITPEKIIYERLAREVILPTKAGQVGIMADHVPYMAPLRADELLVKLEDDDRLEDFESLAIDFGVAEFAHNTLTVLVASAAPAADIDLATALAAQKRAQELMAEEITDNEQYAHALALLERETARIKVASKHQLKHRA